MMECEETRCGSVGPQILGGRRKLEDEDVPPPELPPRPQLCPRHPDRPHQSSIEAHLTKKRLRKYVFLCTVCGGLASLLGGLFLGVYLILRSYTSSLDYFETIPTYIPAAMLLLTGLGIMCLGRRKNRYAVLIKLCGVCCLICAATCVLVTVTTTVIHMSRLQSLRECVYTVKTQTCTCYSKLLESAADRTEEGAHYVFNSTPDCEVIHGALYSCLRAMFGLSVIGILVCIFCCMLVYQLLSHERKKMYWEQLELRCRYLYGQPRNQTVVNTPQRCSHCACSQQFRFPVEGTFENRLWASGRIGNLYSPNPVGDEPPPSSGWAWRLPWSRGENSHQTQPTQIREPVAYNQPLGCSSPDSQYGFTAQGVATVSSATSASYTMIEAPPTQVFQWGPPPPYSDPNSPRRLCPPVGHNCSRQPHVQETYHNLQEIEQEEQRRVRRIGDSSSSSAKSEANPRLEEAVSPRIKYLRTLNPTPRKRAELSESEVYFADVSSCCNGSVRNDSLLYDEPVTPVQEIDKRRQRKDTPLKQPRFVPDKSFAENKEFQKIPEERNSPEAYSEMAHDGSEEDDPELVSFSQRTEARNRISDLSRCRNRMNQDFPSPMSVSSPSSASKEYPDMVTSENGSANSVWSGCSPDFLAPDAQYEAVPDRNNPKKRKDWRYGSEVIFVPREVKRKEDKPCSFEQALSSLESDISELRNATRFEKRDNPNILSPKYDNKKFDKCGNIPKYFDESFQRYSNSDRLHSPRHHYEEIRDTNSPHYESCSTPRSVSRCHLHTSQEFCLSNKNVTINSVDSPKLFEKHLFTGNIRSSPECIALVDESQCSHNDSSCRCSLNLNKFVNDDPIH